MQLRVQMRPTWRVGGLAAWLGVSAAGCYSGLTDGFGGGVGTLGADGDGGSDDGDDGSDDGPAAGCEGASVAAAPMRRLTRLEYDNTVRQLLDDDSAPARGFAPDESVAGFAANAVAPISASQLDQYFDAAETLAATAVTDRWDTVVGCSLDDAACLSDFIDEFGARALRRPLTDEESAGYRDLYDETFDQQGATAAVEIVIEALLMSPSFLYHVEEAPAPDGEAELLGDFEVASRLSYFVWASMPDDELFDLAHAGALSDPAVLEAQARRMLQDDRAASAVGSFHRQWLHIDALEDLVKDTEYFPEWSTALASSMEAETLAFADEVIRRGDGNLRTLLTASWSVIDDELAALYGVEGPGDGFAVTELDGSERAGLLTHASFLASNAHAAETSWVYRGKFVRENLLCGELPAPPVGVEVNDPLDPNRLEDPECSACHLQIDPIGMGLDAYSPIGAFRLVDEAGVDVDISGSIDDVPEVGAFEGGVELANGLADAPRVGDCMATQWFRFAARRKETPQDACTVGDLRGVFADSGQDIRELVVAIAVSDAFRFHQDSQ